MASPSSGPSSAVKGHPLVSSNKRKRGGSDGQNDEAELTQSWKDVLGPVPPLGKTKVNMVDKIIILVRYLPNSSF